MAYNRYSGSRKRTGGVRRKANSSGRANRPSAVRAYSTQRRPSAAARGGVQTIRIELAPNLSGGAPVQLTRPAQRTFRRRF